MMKSGDSTYDFSSRFRSDRLGPSMSGIRRLGADGIDGAGSMAAFEASTPDRSSYSSACLLHSQKHASFGLAHLHREKTAGALKSSVVLLPGCFEAAADMYQHSLSFTFLSVSALSVLRPAQPLRQRGRRLRSTDNGADVGPTGSGHENQNTITLAPERGRQTQSGDGPKWRKKQRNIFTFPPSSPHISVCLEEKTLTPTLPFLGLGWSILLNSGTGLSPVDTQNNE